MPQYYDELRKTWFCKFNYKDYTGKTKQKIKRGFARKKEAQAWEENFKMKLANVPDILFSEMCEMYIEDKKNFNKYSSYKSIEQRLRLWVIPYFKDKAMNDIKPSDIRKWQGVLKNETGSHGKPLSESYMHNIVSEMSCVFNYAIRVHQYTENPCKIAGDSVGSKVKRIDFWTKQEFDTFIATFDKTDHFYYAFLTLYYTGMRIGELSALTLNDIDTKNGIISINKTFKVIDGKEYITPPKTKKSIRDITIPSFMCECLDRFISMHYALEGSDRLFTRGRETYRYQLKTHTEAAEIKKIRLHDLRHSHASLLINNDLNVLLISERLGHESVATTLDIYSHIFPSKQKEVSDRLENMCVENKY